MSGAVDLGLSDEQAELVNSFAGVLGKASPRVDFDPELWSSLVGIGVVDMAVSGASMVDLVLVAEQVGRFLAPAPVIEAQVAARVLGEVPEGLVTFAPQATGLVPAGAVADAVVTVDGRFAPIVERTPVANLADAPLADVVLGPVEEVDAGSALDEWLVLTAGALVGMGNTALEQACAYATERHAFGQPIGAFQGVSHPLADDATNLDGAQLLARKAAWALDRGDDRARELCAMAFAFASTTAEQATYDALHTHGGYGFTLEADVHLFWARARGWPRVWGDAEAGYRRAAEARYR